MDKPTVRKYGANGILIEWKSEISPEINDEVVKTAQFLNEHYGDAILEMVPSYHSLLIFLKKDENVQEHIAILRYRNFSLLQNTPNQNFKTWQIPVCYDDTFGFDLNHLSENIQLQKETIIHLHTEPNYRIYGMGFLPGFLYLGGLNERLHFPRKGQITQHVPKGSVAIGGQQTGIYPQNSPGGWHVIGRTPITMFDVRTEIPTPFSVGDSLHFVAIDMEEFEAIQREIAIGDYQLKTISYD